MLAIKIRNSPEIQGITVLDSEVKQTIYADDLTGFLLNEASIKYMLSRVMEFGKHSGLHVNTDKTEGMGLGSNFGYKNPTLGIRWVTEIEITGIWFSNDKISMQKKKI